MDDSKMPRIRRKEDLPDVMTMPLVAKTLGCSLTVAYSAAFTLDTYTHVTEQMKRGAAEKIGVFMNASINVQVNVIHSPSAVVRGDYQSDLANCLNPSNSTDLDPTSE
ncbi:hypothetical protein JQM63_03330 [Oscillibacter valericigenes]|nr:hypothetical protein [Oscillibacter valericigenes]